MENYEENDITYYVKSIQRELDLLSIDAPTLQPSALYALDSYLRLQEGDIEGSRVSLRKSLEALKVFLNNIKVSKVEDISSDKEIEDFPKRMKGLVNKLQDLLHYGAAHLGPAPKTTTEMLLYATIEIIKGLVKLIEEGILTMEEFPEKKKDKDGTSTKKGNSKGIIV